MSELNDYNVIVDGMTQDDIAFRDAIRELDAHADFYTMKIGAMNKFNHAMVGNVISDDRPIEVVAMLDFDKQFLVVDEWYNERVYNLDEIDPRYLARINDIRNLTGKDVSRVPLTRLAMELLDNGLPDVEDKPNLTSIKSQPVELTASQKRLRQAFNNEMLLMIQLDEYIKDNHLDDVFDSHKDDLIRLVGTHAYDYRFNDAVHELQETVMDKYVPNLSK